MKDFQQVEKKNEALANKAIGHRHLHVRLQTNTQKYRTLEPMKKIQGLCLKRKAFLEIEG